MLSSVALRFTENEDIVVPIPGVTVFVGPNNSGKSLILREIEELFYSHPLPADRKILRSFEIDWPNAVELSNFITKHKSKRQDGIGEGHVRLQKFNPGNSAEYADILENTASNVVEQQRNPGWVATQLLRWGVLRLDGRSRFALTDDQSAGDLLGPPENTLSALFSDDTKREKAREQIFDAFGGHLVIDPMRLGSLRVRISELPPPMDEQSLNSTARKFYEEAPYIKDLSDGMQAYVGIITTVNSGEFETILIDEPEAFLHPPLARKLGRHLGALARERGGALIASTHSADFVMGCVQESKDVRIVRLEFAQSKSRGRLIDSEKLENFFKRPLMRSANVVSGLFHDGVIIAESDNDRAFYAEIYQRMAEVNPYYPSILFVNAQNKQTAAEMVGPLREFGIPAAAVIDIDILKDGGKNWTKWLEAIRAPTVLQRSFGEQRSAILGLFENAGQDMKDGGISLLGPDGRIAANEFFDLIDGYGLFCVRRGELEQWLKNLDVSGKKTDWTVRMLERLGVSGEAEYVPPGSDDVWAFLDGIVTWIRDPGRKGMR